MKIYRERYRSGHNGADSKSVCEQSHRGSNPLLSAKKFHPNGGGIFLMERRVCRRKLKCSHRCASKVLKRTVPVAALPLQAFYALCEGYSGLALSDFPVMRDTSRANCVALISVASFQKKPYFLHRNTTASLLF